MSGRNCLCDIQWWETSYFRISTQSQLWLAGWCAKHGDPSSIHADLCGPGKPFITLSFKFWQTFGFFSNGPKKSSFTHSYTLQRIPPSHYITKPTLNDVSTRIRRTSLCEAAEEGQLLTAEVLIAKGANPNELDSNLETPLHGAVRKGHVGMKMLLLSHGADHKSVPIP